MKPSIQIKQRSCNTSRAFLLMIVMLLCVSAASAARSFWIDGKAIVAQRLLEKAWDKTLMSGTPVKSWSWADTVPVAKLSIPSQDQSLIVLKGSHGESMAFGPATIEYSSNNVQTVAIGGHRDTHLAFLEHLAHGELLLLQDADGLTRTYRLTQTKVVNSESESLYIEPDTGDLVLVTCYPFNATQTGGPFRYIALAKRVEESAPEKT